MPIKFCIIHLILFDTWILGRYSHGQRDWLMLDSVSSHHLILFGPPSCLNVDNNEICWLNVCVILSKESGLLKLLDGRCVYLCI